MVAFNAELIEILESESSRTAIPERLKEFPVAVIGDAMNRLGMCSATLKTTWPGARCVGTAFPIWVTEGDNAAIHAALPHMRAGDVVVIAGNGSLNRALIGDRLAMKFQSQGVAGAIVDGCIRDAADIAKLQFPTWSKGTCPAGPFKNGPGKVGVPVAVGGVAISFGDIIAADDDGIAVIAKRDLSRVLQRAEQILELEMQSKESLREVIAH